MRLFVGFLLALNVMAASVVEVRAQVARYAPPRTEQIPDYPGLYVANAVAFLAGALLFIRVTRTPDVRTYLAQVKTCASDRSVALRLRREGLDTSIIAFQEAYSVLTSGACQVFVGTNFDFALLNRRFDDEDRPQDDVRPPSQPPPSRDDVPSGDDLIVDRTPPEISPLQRVFEGQGRTVEVRARITEDLSRVREAYVLLPGDRQVRMDPIPGTPNYRAVVDLPRDYNDQTASIVAINTANLRSRARITLRLLPWCGPRVNVSGTVVRQVQDGLVCVGQSPGASDGQLGPNTCGAIGSYLGARMDSFNAGRLPWTALRDELERACLAAQSAVLDAPDMIERDSDLVRIPIGLRQAGLTEAIRITGPEIPVQEQAWRGEPLVFGLPMPPPGQQRTILVEAIGPRDTALDFERVLMIRPAVEMNVRPAGMITVEEPFLDFTVLISSGASAISRIEARPAGAEPVVQFLSRGSAILRVPSPEPGATRRVTFVAIGKREGEVARRSVTVERPAPALPPRLTVASTAGRVVDAPSVRLRIVLENPGETERLVLRGGPGMAVRDSVGPRDGVWETTQELPPPGQEIEFIAQALGRAGEVLADDSLRVARPGIELDVSPTGQFEADTDSMIAQARVTSGADWVTTIVARSKTDPVLSESGLENGQARLKIAMPEPGDRLSVEVVAVGRDGEAYAPQNLTLIRPAAEVQQPVTLRVTSPDGFAIDADLTRLSVAVDNPGKTRTIVVSDMNSGEVLVRGPYAGTDWQGQVKMPASGQGKALVIEARNDVDETLAVSQIMLLRPATRGFVIPQWVQIGALVLGGAGIGFLLARPRGRRNTTDPVEDRTRPMVRPRLVAEPDHEPSIELEPTAPPTLSIWVDGNAETQFELEIQQDEGSGT